MTEVTGITDDDIYGNWGKSELRLDVPAYGPEYVKWKQETPPDVQKIILDVLTARRIFTQRLNAQVPRDITNEQIIDSEYSALRDQYIDISMDTIAKFKKFLEENYPNQIPNLLGAGFDGSSLYRPRKNGDIDVFFVFESLPLEARRSVKSFNEELRPTQPSGTKAGRIDVRYVKLDPEIDPEKANLPWIALPHLILVNYGLEDDAYKLAHDRALQLIRENKEGLYDTARWYVKKQGYTWDELTEMVNKD